MSHSSSITAAQPAAEVLDPRTLGRPVHLMKEFAAELRERLESLLREQLNRRYRAAFELGDVTIDAAGSSQPTGDWLMLELAAGRLACRFERELVLAVMSYRYGGAPLGADAPRTSTEDRLAGLLGRELLQGLATQLGAEDRGLPLRAAPQRDAWLLRVPVFDMRLQLRSTLLLALDAGWMNQLLRERSPRRTRPAAALPRAEELAARLPLKLVARLLETELPLGELMALQPGAVIPVSLGATEVLVDGERLFTASVAEHQGKLCLTSFADAD